MPIFPDCSFGPPARLLAAVALLGALFAAPALAQPEADPVLAKVDGQDIHFSDLKAAAETLPPQARAMPPQQLYPMLLEQMIDAQALLVAGAEDRPRQGSGRAAHDADGAGAGAGIRAC